MPNASTAVLALLQRCSALFSEDPATSCNAKGVRSRGKVNRLSREGIPYRRLGVVPLGDQQTTIRGECA